MEEELRERQSIAHNSPLCPLVQGGRYKFSYCPTKCMDHSKRSKLIKEKAQNESQVTFAICLCLLEQGGHLKIVHCPTKYQDPCNQEKKRERQSMALSSPLLCV